MIPISVPTIGEEEKRSVLEVLDSKRLVQGKKVEELETLFSEYIGVDYSIATSNGTTALELALRSLDIKQGDEVITTPFSFISSANCILFTHAKPVFVDIDETFNMNPDLIQEKITDKTKAILPVHLYGQPCDMEKITKIANENSITVVEDACQSHGAEYNRKKTGSFGIGCFSLYATKNITASEGGLITTNNKDLAEKMKLLRNHGQNKRYYHKILGYNYRMTDIASAIGLEQLKKLESMNNQRIQNANILTTGLKDIKGIITPKVKENTRHVFHQYTLRVTDEFKLSRDDFVEYLNKNDIGNAIYYPVPIPNQEVYVNLGYKEKIPMTEKITKQVISIPVHPSLTNDDLNKIIEVIRNAS